MFLSRLAISRFAAALIGLAATTDLAQSAPATPAASSAVKVKEWPSFLSPNDVLCLDELDFNAFKNTGRFHSRGSQESCTQILQLTRVVVLRQMGGKSEIRVVNGPLTYHVGWTNGRLPIAPGAM